MGILHCTLSQQNQSNTTHKNQHFSYDISSTTSSSNKNNNNNNNDNNMLVFITILIFNACVAGTIPATPENITVTFLSPTTVRVAWQTMIDINAHPVEKYIVTYKPSDDRIVQDVAGNSEEIILDRLSPSTQYSIAVTAIWLGKKYRSRQIIFRTLDLPKSSTQQDLFSLNQSGSVIEKSVNAATNNMEYNGSAAFDNNLTSTVTNILSEGQQRELPTVRGVEIGIVLMVLMVWAGAIALFFNRWGKIRMLLPYQPDYKHEQLKVPGTGVCSAGVCNGQHSHQHIHILEKERSVSISERCSRSRINSAIFVSSDGKGFDSIEFLRRHGSQSVLCRKAQSAENITDNARKKSFCENSKQQWGVESSNERPTNIISIENAKYGNQGNVIELRERRPSTLPVYKTNMKDLATTTTALASNILKGNLAPVTTTTTNMIVGSVSIEAPPAHLTTDETQTKQSPLTAEDSCDTVPKETVSCTKSRTLVHQSLSNAGNYRSQSFSSSSSTQNSPKAQLNVRIIKPKIEGLPMVSVSGPSPPTEKPPSNCL